MLKLGIIRESTSSYSSPLWLVKKSNGIYWVCFDSRKLNNVIVNKGAFPLPLIDTILIKFLLSPRNKHFIKSI